MTGSPVTGVETGAGFPYHSASPFTFAISFFLSITLSLQQYDDDWLFRLFPRTLLLISTPTTRFCMELDSYTSNLVAGRALVMTSCEWDSKRFKEITYIHVKADLRIIIIHQGDLFFQLLFNLLFILSSHAYSFQILLLFNTLFKRLFLIPLHSLLTILKLTPSMAKLEIIAWYSIPRLLAFMKVDWVAGSSECAIA